MSKVFCLAVFSVLVIGQTWKIKAAELALICPCKVERVGQTAVQITASVKNDGETASGDVRIVLGSASELPISLAYGLAFRYLPETLRPGEIYTDQATIAFTLPTKVMLNNLNRAHLILRLQEHIGEDWLTKDTVRLGAPVNFPSPELGGESARGRLFLEGKPTFEIDGKQATLRIPKVVNSSLETVTINRVYKGNFPSAEFWGSSSQFSLNAEDLSLAIPARSSITDIEITGRYWEPATTDPFTMFYLRSQDGVELWETLEARGGNVIPTYPFKANSFDFLTDSDGDGVSDYNENLLKTDAEDPLSQPETIMLDVMALYTPVVSKEYNEEPMAMILHELEWGNQAFRNSNVNMRFRLVKSKLVNYDGLAINEALDAVQEQTGVFEGIDSLRKEAGADLLVLYIEKDPSSLICGLALLSAFGEDGDLAFYKRNQIAAVVAKGASGCRTSNLTHEFGHNLGLGHDSREVANRGTFRWSRGHGVDNILSTIMAYEDGFSYFGPEFQNFSNPKVSCGRAPCGVDKSDFSFGADAALSIRTTMYQIAQLSGDSDYDGTDDNTDNCPLIANSSQSDMDLDGLGDACDKDDDGDGVLDTADAFPLDASETLDSDKDGVGDNADAFPLDASEQIDTDGDGVGNNADAFPDNLTKSVYDCVDSSFVPKLAGESTLPFEKKLVIANPASNNNQQTFLRFVNPWADSIQVQLYAIDDVGTAGGPPISFTLSAQESKQMTAQDLENGNASKGILAPLCNGEGKWQITARSSKEIQIMGLIRTPDGFLTGLTDVVPVESGSNIVYFANPSSTREQQTFLRIVNNDSAKGTVTISAIDNRGVKAAETVTFELAANSSKQMTAQDLENGNNAKGLNGKLGDGSGKWRLTIESSLDLSTQSLIRTPDGFLTNMSAIVTPNRNGSSTVSFLNPASNTAQRSFIRLINSSNESASVTISAIDDAGQIAPNGDISLTIGAGESLEFSANDLEQGDAELKLLGSLGEGSGRWRLNITSEPKIKVMSYVLTPTGFLTNMSEVSDASSSLIKVWMFNPGSNKNQASKLRVINNGSSTAKVTISGVDDAGNSGPGTDLIFNLPYASVTEITATELENGSSEKGLTGGIGDGRGKWRLTVTSDEPITVQSLLETPAGFITNLSTSAK